MSYSAGFDFSSNLAVFSVIDSEKGVLFDRAMAFPGRDASSLPGQIFALLEEHDLLPEDITSWSVGAGPGSFTGLRIAAAFVSGLAFRKEVKIRGVSSAAALAHTLFSPEDGSVLAVYDGRKNELLACGLKAENGFFTEDGFRAVIRSQADMADAYKLYPRLAALECDMPAIRTVCPDWPPLFRAAEHIFAATLAAWRPDDFSRSVSDLTYLRPAVFVPPAPIRQNL